MTLFLKRNLYETLGVNAGATPDEIENAYKRAKSLFSEDSDAAYSLYTEEERHQRIEALNAAYETLSSPEKKREYDMTLGKAVQEDGTYEVDLGYIFEAQKKGPQSVPETVIRQRSYGKAGFSKTIAVLDKSEQLAAEQFKLLSSKLEQASRKPGQKVIAFTSAIKGEGKSAVSLNTAFMLAATFGRNVALIECDLRKPSSLLEQVSLEGPGLSEVLKGEAALDDAIYSVEDSGLHVIPAGSFGENVADLIGSVNTAGVINSLRQRFDLVLLDCPPVIPLADMSIIEKLVDGIVLIVRAGSTSRQLVMNAIESLDKKKFIGAVLNGAETKLDKYYY